LHYRDAPGASPDDAAAASRASGGVPDDRLVGDVGSSADYLRALPGSNGKIGVIGYCSGGRQSFLAACSLQLDAAVDCYGAAVVRAPEGLPVNRADGGARRLWQGARVPHVRRRRPRLLLREPALLPGRGGQ
jgi:carboxymethylenebutenolidase